jgi:hypothetical protein
MTAAIKDQMATREGLVKEKREWWLKMAKQYGFDMDTNDVRVDFVKNILVDTGPKKAPSAPAGPPIYIPGGRLPPGAQR